MRKELILARLETLYDDYLRTVDKLERERKPADGLLGLRPGPADDPCHDRFAADLAELLRDFAADGADSAAARAVLETVYAAPLKHPEPKSSYWMLVAVQGLTRDLIALLSTEDAAEVAARFAEDYPRRERLPVQDELLSLLRQRAGAPAPRRLFRRRR